MPRGVRALEGVSWRVGRGEIVTLIRSNGLAKRSRWSRQNARMGLRLAHRGDVIQTGRIALEDRECTRASRAPAAAHSDVVRKVYLGEK